MLEDKEVIAALASYDNVKERVRVDPDYVHVSTIVSWCPREHALSLRYLDQSPVYKTPSSSDRITWEIGRAVEKRITKMLIQHYGKRNIFANWTCPCEYSFYTGLYFPGMLSACCNRPYEHAEFVIKSKKYQVSGSIDLIPFYKGLLVPFEIKSATDSDNAKKQGMAFSLLKAPMGNHCVQLSLYQQLMKEGGLRYPVADYGKVVYVRKEHRFFDIPYKSFTLDCKPGSVWNKQANILKHTAKPVFDTKNLPERRCATSTCTRAKECPWVSPCFSLS